MSIIMLIIGILIVKNIRQRHETGVIEIIVGKNYYDDECCFFAWILQKVVMSKLRFYFLTQFVVDI